jgi:hypothetical protein
MQTEAIRDSLAQVQELLGRATPGPWSYCGQSGGHACSCGLVWGAGDHSPAVAEFSLTDDEYEGHRPGAEERQANTEAVVMAVNWLRTHGPALLEMMEERDGR